MNELKECTEKMFEDIKHIDEEGNEYWLARELQSTLGYHQWRSINDLIVRAKVARKDADGKRVKEVVDGKKVTVYDEVEKEIKKDMPSRLHARRQMVKALYDVTEVPTAAAGKKKNTKKVDLTNKLFNEIAPKYASRNGGYTRIIKIGQRKGDGAMAVLIELV